MCSIPPRLHLLPALLALGSGLLAAAAPDPLPPVGGAGNPGRAPSLIQPAAPPTAVATAPAAPTQAKIQVDYGKLPYTFEANGGQADVAVKFLARGPGYSLFLTPGEAVLSLHTSQPNPAPRPRPGARPEPVPDPTPAAVPEPTAAATSPAVLRLSLVGANPDPVIRGEAALPGKVNYLTGKDPAAWRTGLSTYAKVRYESVYPGVDLIYYGTQGQLEYDLVLAPGADPKVIRLAFAGADQMTLDDTGNLVLTLGEQQVIQHTPRVYQERNGERTPVPTRYVLADNRQVSLAVGDYDAGRALVIDPVLVYSSYLGGAGYDQGMGIAVDGAGNAYLTGYTASTDFPIRLPQQPDHGGGRFDAFVTKIADLPTAAAAALPWLAALGDLTGDGSQHLAVLFVDAAAGTVTARIKQAATGILIQTFAFDQGYTPLDLAVIPDQNANGAPELALLGRYAANGRVQVEVRDTRTGERLSAVAFNPAFAPQRLAVLPDRNGNGNGAAELAVLGINAGNGAIAAEIKDAATGARLGKVFFAKTFQPVDFAAVADANGAAELAVLGVNAAGQPRVELRDSASAALVKVLWSPIWTTPLNLTEVPDANGNGTPEVAVLGRGRGGAVLVKTADAGTAVQLGFVYYNRTFTPHQVAALPDLNANGVAELAVLSRDAAGQLKTELRDAVTGTLVRNLWFDQLAPLDLAVLSDLNGNGSPEIAVLGVPAAGGAQVLIKDSATQAQISWLDF